VKRREGWQRDNRFTDESGGSCHIERFAAIAG
jgi:hypothetical protein